MKYKILWFEDDPDIVNNTVGPRISRYLENLGFECEFQHQLNGKDREKLVKEQNYDLVLTDLNLEDADTTGEKIIDDIRNYDVLTEVLLYSESDEAINNIIGRTGKVIERISFSAGISNLLEKIQKIIFLSVKKIQDVNNMRGLVIAQTIDLENSMEEMVLQYFRVPAGSVLNPPKDVILKEIHEKKLGFHRGKIEEIEKIQPSAIEEMIEKDVLTAENTYQAVMRIIKTKITDLNSMYAKEPTGPKRDSYKEELESAEEIKTIMIDFHNEVLLLRNTLAHVEEKKEADGTPYLESLNRTGTTIRFNDAKYAEIRKNLRKHSDNLKKFSSNLEDW